MTFLNTLTVLTLLVPISLVKCQVFKMPNVLLYEDTPMSGTGVLIYAERFEDFNDVLGLADIEGLSKISLICVKHGVFIFYKEVDYMANSAEDVRIISGDLKCVSPGPVYMGSIRHAGSIFVSITISHISLFDGLNYVGMVYTVTEISTLDVQLVSPVRSMILIGPSKWTVVTKEGKKYCLEPYTDEEDEKKIFVCIVPDVSEVVEKDSDLHVVEVLRDCAEDSEIIAVHIDTCFDYQSGEIQNPAVAPMLPPSTNATTGGEASTDSLFSQDCESEALVETIELLRFRLTNDFITNYQFQLPHDKRHTWRAELLDLTIEAAVTFLPHFVVDDLLLFQLREFYIYFAEKLVWSKGKEPEDKRKRQPTYETLVVIHETKECILKLKSSDGLLSKRDWKLLGFFATLDGPKFPENLILPSLRLSLILDPLMEYLWLIVNLVGVSCHIAKEYETNYWIDYTSIVNEMYLTPMTDQWVNPEKVQKLYPILFGGFDLKIVYERIAAATTAVYRVVPYMEIFPRPDTVMKAAEKNAPKSPKDDE